MVDTTKDTESIVYLKDTTRGNKLLSVGRVPLCFNHDGGTDGVMLLLGASHLAWRGYASSENPVIDCSLMGKFTIAADKQLAIQHICANTLLNQGFGEAAGNGVEIFTEVELVKVD